MNTFVMKKRGIYNFFKRYNKTSLLSDSSIDKQYNHRKLHHKKGMAIAIPLAYYFFVFTDFFVHLLFTASPAKLYFTALTLT